MDYAIHANHFGKAVIEEEPSQLLQFIKTLRLKGGKFYKLIHSSCSHLAKKIH